MGAFQYCYLGYQNTKIKDQNFISGNLLPCKLVHTFRVNSCWSSDVTR